MNYFNRENNEWYEKKIGDNFKQISKGKYIRPLEYYGKTNSLTTYVDSNFEMYLKISNKKPLKAIFNIKYKESAFYAISFGTYDKNGGINIIDLKKSKKKKEYDGSYTFTLDLREEDCNQYIVLEKEEAFSLITFKYLTIDFEETFTFFNYKYYKEAISSYMQ